MARTNRLHRRATTAFSRDGRTVFVTLNVDRRDYEYARHWAVFHARADPEGTAECQLEGFLNSALLKGQIDDGWEPLPEIKALYAPLRKQWRIRSTQDDDDIPF